MLWPPPPIFGKSRSKFVFKLMIKKPCLKVQNLQHKFLGWNWPRPPLELLLKLIRFGEANRPFHVIIATYVTIWTKSSLTIFFDHDDKDDCDDDVRTCSYSESNPQLPLPTPPQLDHRISRCEERGREKRCGTFFGIACKFESQLEWGVVIKVMFAF